MFRYFLFFCENVMKKVTTNFRFTKKTEDALKDWIKRYKRIIKTAYEKWLNESDTNNILTDFLADMFGYDKFL